MRIIINLLHNFFTINWKVGKVVLGFGSSSAQAIGNGEGILLALT